METDVLTDVLTDQWICLQQTGLINCGEHRTPSVLTAYHTNCEEQRTPSVLTAYRTNCEEHGTSSVLTAYHANCEEHRTPSVLTAYHTNCEEHHTPSVLTAYHTNCEEHCTPSVLTAYHTNSWSEVNYTIAYYLIRKQTYFTVLLCLGCLSKQVYHRNRNRSMLLLPAVHHWVKSQQPAFAAQYWPELQFR